MNQRPPAPRTGCHPRTGRLPGLLLFAALLGAAGAHASPQSAVEAVLGKRWKKQKGSAWEKTTDNTVVGVLHTPQNSFGVPKASRPNGDHLGKAKSCTLNQTCQDAAGVDGLCMDFDYLRKKKSDTAPTLCGSHSDQMLNEVWSLLSTAHQLVDLTSLSDAKGALQGAVRNGLLYAASELVRTGSKETLTVRLLLGEQHAPPWLAGLLPQTTDTKELFKQESHIKDQLDYLGKDLDKLQAAQVQLYGGIYHPSLSIWNHAKMIAVDGREALVGGHNLWPESYLTPQAGVHDLSVRIAGGAALSAHRFANVLWDTVCSWPQPPDDKGEYKGAQSVFRWDAKSGKAVNAVTKKSRSGLWKACESGITRPDLPKVVSSGTGVTVIGVGKTGLWRLDQLALGATGSGRNPSDDALAALIHGATKEVLVDQQGLAGATHDYAEAALTALSEGSKVPELFLKPLRPLVDSVLVSGVWMDRVVRELAAAVARGVSVKIIVSDPHHGEAGYLSNGAEATLDAILAHWPKAYRNRPKSIKTAEQALLCNLQVTHLRDSEEHAARNHSKAVIVDEGTSDAGYYIGSQNLYPNDLAEYGYLVFDQGETGKLRKQVWDEAWLHSAGAGGERIFSPCGPKSGQAAASVFGQPDFKSDQDNRGGSQPDNDTLNSPNGIGLFGRHALISDSNNGRLLLVDLPKGVASQCVYQADCQSRVASSSASAKDLGRVTDGNRLSAASLEDEAWRWVLSDSGRNRVIVTTRRGKTLERFVLGQADFQGSSAGTSDSALNGPMGVFTDGKRILVADTGNNRVLVWDDWPRQDGEPADHVLGQPDFTSKTAQKASAKSMSGPRGVTSDGTRVFVADSGNDRVLVWNELPEKDGAPADLVLGQAGMDKSGSATSASGLSGPSGLEVYRGGLFVADSGNNRVVLFNPIPRTDGEAASVALGQDDLTSKAAAGPTEKSLLDPQDLQVEGGKLFVVDRGHHRIVEFRVYLRPE